MNSILWRRFMLYCTAALTVFALVLGGIYEWQLRSSTRAAAVADLIVRAEAVASLVAADVPAPVGSQRSSEPATAARPVGGCGMISGGGMHRHGMEKTPREKNGGHDHPGSSHAYCRRVVNESAGSGLYLRQLEPLAGGTVWLVDRGSRTITLYGAEESASFDDLPAEAETLLERIFSGQAAASQAFDPLLTAPSVTAGAPVKDTSGNVIGAVLLHRTLNAVDIGEYQGRRLLLFAMAVAFLVASGLSFLLARRFLRPLARMEKVAAALARGHYDARTGIAQEDEVGSLAQSLDALAARLADAAKESARLTQMRQDFLTSVSHELRTPLTVLRGSLEVLDAGLFANEEERRRYLAQMEDNVRQLERLVGDLFELTRLQNMDFQIEKAPANLTDALSDAIRSARRLAAQREIAIVSGDLPPILMTADFGRLRQMFLIVLDNAVKFSPAKGIVEITVKKEGPRWSIALRDHGPGIAKAVLPHLFQRFRRQKSEANAGGTGLGLAIAKAIADRHDIALTAANAADGGAIFTFCGTQPHSIN